MSNSINSIIARLNQEQDVLRRKLIDKIQENTGRKLINYIARFEPAGSIIPDDVLLFNDVLTSLNFPSELDLIIHSPGGLVEVTEKIVLMIRSKVKSLRVIIPDAAKSAATLLALSANEILMSDLSEIGPIDPQILVGIDPSTRQPIFRPAWSYLNSLKELEEELKVGRSPAIVIPLVGKIDPTLLDVAKKSIDYSKSLAKKWLVKYMGLTEENANKIADYLSSAEINLTHARAIKYEEAKELGLKVVLMNSELANLIHELYMRSRLALQMNRVKLIECDKSTIFQEVVTFR
jgi:ClpP class serine protease